MQGYLVGLEKTFPQIQSAMGGLNGSLGDMNITANAGSGLRRGSSSSGNAGTTIYATINANTYAGGQAAFDGLRDRAALAGVRIG